MSAPAPQPKDRTTAIRAELRAALAQLVDLAEAAALTDDPAEVEAIATKAASLGTRLASALPAQQDHQLRGGNAKYFNPADITKGAPPVAWPSDLSAHVVAKRARGETSPKDPRDVSEGVMRKRAARARGAR